MRTVPKIVTALMAGVLVAGLALPVAAEVVRGRDLMTAEEWTAHRTEMLAAKTAAERDAVRAKWQSLMETRAAENDDVLMHQVRPGRPMGPAHRLGPGPRFHAGWGPCWAR